NIREFYIIFCSFSINALIQDCYTKKINTRNYMVYSLEPVGQPHSAFLYEEGGMRSMSEGFLFFAFSHNLAGESECAALINSTFDVIDNQWGFPQMQSTTLSMKTNITKSYRKNGECLSINKKT
ncbi:MAG: hypothetical protein K8S56_05135, partial [Candidatus Cloacimonetes bacterium]|nr:hypothetical protein [Candidatus Cloacimonadota bacterium]